MQLFDVIFHLMRQTRMSHFLSHRLIRWKAIYNRKRKVRKMFVDSPLQK